MSATGIDADVLVIFGITGDLGETELLPALVQLSGVGALPPVVIGVGRSGLSDDELRARLADVTGDRGRDALERFELRYVAGDTDDRGTFDTIVERSDGAQRPVVYAALPPSVMGELGDGLAAGAWADVVRLVVEKPFGHDVASARELHGRLTERLGEDRLLLVDHFLASAAVENVRVSMTSNRLLLAGCRAPHVERIEITMAERFGVDGRGGFYESVGAVGDVLQNHLVQLLAAVITEPPADPSAASVAAARQEALRAVRPFSTRASVRGQYAGYRDLDDVADDSDVETYVAARTTIDAERWNGTTVAVRAGKRLSDTRTVADLVLAGSDDALADRVRFEVAPGSSLSLRLARLDPATHGPAPGHLALEGPIAHGGLGAYATMLRSALKGERRHFAGLDDVTEGWRLVEALRSDPSPPQVYAPDTLGPAAADDLLDGGWQRLNRT